MLKKEKKRPRSDPRIQIIDNKYLYNSIRLFNFNIVYEYFFHLRLRKVSHGYT